MALVDYEFEAWLSYAFENSFHVLNEFFAAIRISSFYWAHWFVFFTGSGYSGIPRECQQGSAKALC